MGSGVVFGLEGFLWGGGGVRGKQFARCMLRVICLARHTLWLYLDLNYLG